MAVLGWGRSSVLCYCVKRKCIKVAVEQQALKADSSTKTPQPLTLVVMYIIDASLGVLVEDTRPIGSALAFAKLANLQG